MTIPGILFRYRPLTTYSLAELANSHIWFSSVMEFNDPFEFQFQIRHLEETPDNREFVISTIQTGTGLPRDAVEAELNTYDWGAFRETFEMPRKNLMNAIRTQGVCCFSSRNDNLLMWGHYTGGHTGYVIGYDTSCFPFAHAIPVLYSDHLCSFSIHDLFHRMAQCLEQIVTRKATDWSYEEEYRLIHKRDHNQVAVPFDPVAIKSIYFGAKCTQQDREMIARLTSHLQPDFFAAELDPGNYAIQFRPLKCVA
jgi:hypothetical protein